MNTTPFNIFRSELHLESVRAGLPSTWIDEVAQQRRILGWWLAGENIDEARRMVRVLAEGYRRAEREKRSSISAAVKLCAEKLGRIS